jgi:hypothetical protein
MPATFHSLGISFQYPDNWTLDDSDALLGRKSVTVYSPGGAFWSVTIHSGSADPAKLAAAVVEAMKHEYEGLEAQNAQETMAGRRLTGYDLAFYCLDLTNSACVRSLRVGHSTYTVFWQAEDRELNLVKRVFQAITTTLLSSLQGPNL